MDSKKIGEKRILEMDLLSPKYRKRIVKSKKDKKNSRIKSNKNWFHKKLEE